MRSGQKVGKYTLGERIARGGMAEVWAARVEGPEGFIKPMALKFVVDSGDPELERLFVSEARLAAALQHPNLVTVFDFDRIVDATDFGSPGRYYIAMERVEGHDLRRVFEANRESGHRFPIALALYVMAEVLQGLRYVHERPPLAAGRRGSPLVHRDVSPHNILIAFTGDVKLSDFGIAKSLFRGATTQPGLVRGKLAYASPEQLEGRPVDHRSDQFSLGVTLWEMLAGERLFGGGDDAAIMSRVSSGRIPGFRPELDIDPSLEDLVRRMLSLDPDRRFPTTSAVLSAVMKLPGYSGDGAALGSWMGTRFSPRDPELPPTQELPLPCLTTAVGKNLPAVIGSTRLPRRTSDRPPPAPRNRIGRRDGHASSTSSNGKLAKRPAATRPGTPTRPPRPRPGPRSAVVVDLATRGRLRARRGPELKWGLVALGVAVMAWGAAIEIAESRGHPHLARKTVAGNPGPRIDPAFASSMSAVSARVYRKPIVAEPVRSGDPWPTNDAEIPVPGAAAPASPPSPPSSASPAADPVAGSESPDNEALRPPRPTARELADERQTRQARMDSATFGEGAHDLSPAGRSPPASAADSPLPPSPPSSPPARPSRGPINPNGAPIIE